MKSVRNATRIVPVTAGVLALFLLAEPLRGQDLVDLRTRDLPRWTLEEELRLGSVNGEHDAFVRPVRLRVGPRGRLYVLDAALPALRVFDRAGSYLRQIGRKGDGPGEYTAPVNFGLRGDTTWVVDGVSRRVAFYGADGHPFEAFALTPEASGTQPPLPVNVLGPDDFLVVTPAGPGKSLRGYRVGRVSFQQSLVRRNRPNSHADTLATYTVEPGLMVTQADAEGFSVIPYRQIPQHPIVAYYAEREELVEIERAPATDPDRGEFRVTVRRPRGDVVADRRFVYRPVPLPTAVKDSIRKTMRSRFERPAGGQPPGTRERMEVALKHLALPDFLPPVSLGMAVGDDGTRWIAREQLPGAPVRHLVTDAALEPLATVELPPTALRLAGPFDRDHVWLVETDEYDVQYLVRYRIRKE